MAKIRLASPLQFDSIVDGPGIRMVLWTQGCLHHCPGCHNPSTHDQQQGIVMDTQEVIEQIAKARLQAGLTLSGGEPFLQAEGLQSICLAAKQFHLNIWAYSGFTYEELLLHEAKRNLLTLLDVVVDGRFQKDDTDYRLRFKGSRNQRIIDVPSSLRMGRVIRSVYDDDNVAMSEG